MKKPLSLLLTIALTIFFAGCKHTAKLNISPDSPYNFESYENKSGISDIEPIALNGDLSEKCVTYKFTYTSDIYSVKAYISIPIDCIESSAPYECIIYNRGGNSNIGLLDDEDTAVISAETDRIVLASQYRGADGGTGQDQFGGDDLTDVTTLIDLCENCFECASIDKLCVAGVSRGGIMTYMTARTVRELLFRLPSKPPSDFHIHTANHRVNLRYNSEVRFSYHPCRYRLLTSR